MPGLSVAELRRAARDQGWTERKCGSGHWQMRAPDGKTLVVLPATGKVRGHTAKNNLQDMRRAGLKV